MKNDRPSTPVVDVEHNLYPHFKITAERFPRALATRIVDVDSAEYFGPLLPRTSVRILIDFINRTFRLRTCDIDVDGTFPVPCTMYYRRRCLAPCVASLCDEQTYRNRVGLVRLFLADERKQLAGRLRASVETASDNLDFEAAARWRDMLVDVEKWWANERLNIWLTDTVDTLATESVGDGTAVYLVTQRNRYVLGRKVFTLPTRPDEALYEVLSSFYHASLPREIRVYREFTGRRNVEALLTERFGAPVKIKVVRHIDQRVTARRALHETRGENELDRVRPRLGPHEISKELQRSLKLIKPPLRIEAFDVAHISGTDFAAARSVWDTGRFVSADFGFEISEDNSELGALASAVRDRLLDRDRPPLDLVLVDGGKAQLNAVRAELLSALGPVPVEIAGAVKPKGRHSAVSHFILASGWEVGFDLDNPAHAVLQLLRDEAHELSNRVHRDLRDMGHFYEVAAILPSLTEPERRQVIAEAGTIRKLLDLTEQDIRNLLSAALAERVLRDLGTFHSRGAETFRPVIVPIRYVDENGNADDLIPIASR
jgi:excinuclease ABC subunit C